MIEFSLIRRLTMTEETQTSAEEQKTEQPVSDTAAKAQEVGKKLTGFLGGLAEKAKNIDVKELTEKAKQKVNEVKDKAAEVSSGKTENTIPPRETMAGDQMKQLFTTVAQTADEIPPVVLAVLADVSQGEQIALRMKFGNDSDPVFAVLSDKSFYQFVKSSDQFSVSIYPLSGAKNFSLLPPRGEVAGRFIVSFGKEEVKFTLNSLETYAKALMLYKKVRDAAGK